MNKFKPFTDRIDKSRLPHKVPSLGIAFSGGGARGFSHIGVVLALEQYGLKASVVSGVSAGAIAAVMYAAGMKGSEMRQCFKEHLHFGDFYDLKVPVDGLMRLTRFQALLRKWLPIKRIEETVIPVYVCATDLDHGLQKSFTEGDAARCVVASCSIPVIFSPVKIDGVNYVDGGVLRNLPATPIRDKCDILLGCNCRPPVAKSGYRKSLLSIAWRSYSLMAYANVLPDIELCDYLIENPNLGKYKIFSVREMDKIIMDGYNAASPVIEQIAEEYFS